MFPAFLYSPRRVRVPCISLFQCSFTVLDFGFFAFIFMDCLPGLTLTCYIPASEMNSAVNRFCLRCLLLGRLLMFSAHQPWQQVSFCSLTCWRSRSADTQLKDAIKMERRSCWLMGKPGLSLCIIWCLAVHLSTLYDSYLYFSLGTTKDHKVEFLHHTRLLSHTDTHTSL